MLEHPFPQHATAQASQPGPGASGRQDTAKREGTGHQSRQLSFVCLAGESAAGWGQVPPHGCPRHTLSPAKVRLGVESLSHRAPARAHTHPWATPSDPHLPLPPHTPRPDARPHAHVRLVRHGARGRGGAGRGSCNDTHRSVVIATWTTSNRMPASHPRHLLEQCSEWAKQKRGFQQHQRAVRTPATHALHPLPCRAPHPTPPSGEATGGQASGLALPAAQLPAHQRGPFPQRWQLRGKKTVPESRGQGLQAAQKSCSPQTRRLLADAGWAVGWLEEDHGLQQGAMAASAGHTHPPDSQLSRGERPSPPPPADFR